MRVIRRWFVLAIGLLPLLAATDCYASQGGNTNPLSIPPDLAVFTAIIFLVLLAVLWKFAWGPIMEDHFLGSRTAAIDSPLSPYPKSPCPPLPERN